MAITYPLTLPVNPAPRSFTITQSTFSAVTVSPWSAAQQVQLNAGQAWSISMAFPPMSDDQARNWVGVLSGLNGRFGTVLLGDPRWKTPRGNWVNGATVNGAGQSGQVLSITGLAASAVVRAGDYFQLGSGATSRLYVVTQDATATAGGTVSLDIWPRLRATPGGGDAVVTKQPRGVFRLTTTDVVRQWDLFRHGFALDFSEAL